jgi:hypothetical protein
MTIFPTPATQTRGMHKKMKAQRTPPEYMITKDDAEMIAQMVQYHTSEDSKNVVHHKDRIQEELEDMQQFLKQIEEMQGDENNIGTGSSTSHAGEESEACE